MIIIWRHTKSTSIIIMLATRLQTSVKFWGKKYFWLTEVCLSDTYKLIKIFWIVNYSGRTEYLIHGMCGDIEWVYFIIWSSILKSSIYAGYANLCLKIEFIILFRQQLTWFTCSAIRELILRQWLNYWKWMIVVSSKGLTTIGFSLKNQLANKSYRLVDIS